MNGRHSSACAVWRQGANRAAPCGSQAGLTIVELMVSITLGLLVVMAATALLLSSKSGYTVQDDATRIQDTGRFAIENVTRAVRQAAYENWDREQAPILTVAAISANLNGLDAHSLKDNTPGIESPVPKSVNGSDVLVVRYFGVGGGTNGDGTILNCAGFGVPAPASQESASDDRGWSIFYVAADKSGEPELRCKYRGKTAWTSDAIVRGVESFQLLYGVDTDADGLPNQFLTANAIQNLDASLTLAGASPEEKELDQNKKTFWKKVVVVKVALLVRGSENVQSNVVNPQYNLFGVDYAEAHGALDSGTRIVEKDLPAATRNRLRKVFTVTIQLRNHGAGGAA